MRQVDPSGPVRQSSLRNRVSRGLVSSNLGRGTLIRQIFHVYLFTPRAARRFQRRPVQFLFPGTRRKIVRMPIFQMSVHRPLRMISRILDAFDNARFERLIVLGKLLNALVRRIRDRRELLAISGLAGAIGADLPWIIAQFV